MVQQKNSRLRRLMLRAREEPKHSIYIYEWYKTLISGFNLSSTEYEDAIRTLSNMLQV
nr:MAG TPA: hypothetical protein [Caudoviricetes sp.]